MNIFDAILIALFFAGPAILLILGYFCFTSDEKKYLR